ncbi:hypothetical protein ANO11243_039170 [Dothideomycetidae sp. 11243]|nr:hypothetical protein ANO11243_039170 [fungal sp. No.11243]
MHDWARADESDLIDGIAQRCPAHSTPASVMCSTSVDRFFFAVCNATEGDVMHRRAVEQGAVMQGATLANLTMCTIPHALAAEICTTLASLCGCLTAFNMHPRFLSLVGRPTRRRGWRGELRLGRSSSPYMQQRSRMHASIFGRYRTRSQSTLRSSAAIESRFGRILKADHLHILFADGQTDSATHIVAQSRSYAARSDPTRVAHH